MFVVCRHLIRINQSVLMACIDFRLITACPWPLSYRLQKHTGCITEPSVATEYAKDSHYWPRTKADLSLRSDCLFSLDTASGQDRKVVWVFHTNAFLFFRVVLSWEVGTLHQLWRLWVFLHAFLSLTLTSGPLPTSEPVHSLTLGTTDELHSFLPSPSSPLRLYTQASVIVQPPFKNKTFIYKFLFNTLRSYSFPPPTSPCSPSAYPPSFKHFPPPCPPNPTKMNMKTDNQMKPRRKK